MNERDSISRSASPRVLVFSQKNIYRPEVWRCPFREFEAIIQRVDSVDILAPSRGRFFQLRKNHAQRVGKYLPVALNPGVPKTKLDREYELFLAVCEKPSELLNVNVLKGWTERCRTSVCWVPEIWIKDIPSWKGALEILSKFDHVFLNVARTVAPLSRAIRKECRFLPAGIDALAFSPYPKPPLRFIDVLSVGRRLETTHRELLNMAREGRIFYYYDTLSDLHSYDLEQHRFLMTNLAKRSRYFTVNPGKIDSPDETGGQIEFGYRYFEGAASGAIMIGDYPDSVEFRDYFPWPDAVIRLPFGSGGIGRIIDHLDGQPERLEEMRRSNIVQSLLRHDWAYRWETILLTAGLKPTPELQERKNRLRELSEEIEG